MLKVLIADKIAQQALDVLDRLDQVQVETHIGLDEDQLAQIVGKYHGMIIRSGVKVTDKVLAKSGQLRAIVRAGVGVDNIDLKAATRAGVLVMNTPDANTISTAEHTIGMIIALSRNVVGACTDTRAGNWNRAKFIGSQLAGKTLGLIGLGRVGRAVANRALALDMKVWVYDPLFAGQSALEGKVKLINDLEELLKNCHYLSIHAPLTAQTRNMIGPDQLAMMKPDARVINCARGGILDEKALYQALVDGKLAGAALDVFAAEPPKGNALLELDNVIVTCHLGASTREAQLAVSVDAAQLLLDYLLNGQVQSAVNIAGLPASLTDQQQAYVDLVRRMAGLIGPLLSKGLQAIKLNTTGLEQVCPLLMRIAVVEILSKFMETSLNIVNAELVAEQCGIELSFSCQAGHSDAQHRVKIELIGQEQQHTIVGAIDQAKIPTILDIDGYRMQMVPEGNMVVLLNDDQPGVIGLVGSTFGQHKVNIADLTLSRQADTALMVFKIDSPAPEKAIEQLRAACPPVRQVCIVSLPPIEA